MLQPRFQVGALDVTIEHPSDYSLKPIVAKNGQTTLDGTLREDTLYRKQSYVLSYEMMAWQDYEDLEDVILYSLDNNLPITFTWPKWSWSASGVLVRIELPERNKGAGSGASGFYSKVDIVITEENPR